MLSREQDLFNSPEPNSSQCIEESDHFLQEIVKTRTLFEQQQKECYEEIRDIRSR